LFVSTASMHYNPFHYLHDALPILQLVPGENTRLECEISTHVLDSPEAPAHTALSYTWDNPKHDNLVVNGQRISEKDELRTKYKRSEEHTSELQSRFDLVCRLLLEK